jgi:hypothetical protein
MFKKDFGRHSWGWIALVMAAVSLITALHTSIAFADRVEIFDVHKNLAMTKTDVVYKDYYLSAGRDSGLKEKMIVSVTRSIPVFDHARNIGRGDLDLRMGQVKIIYVGARMSIARAYTTVNRADNPVTDVDNFMIGDRLDLSEAYIEKGPGSGDANNGKAGNPEGESVTTPSSASPSSAATAPASTMAPAVAAPTSPAPAASTAPPTSAPGSSAKKSTEESPRKRDVASDHAGKTPESVGTNQGPIPAPIIR